MKYILMHRELSVAVLYINDVSGTVYRVEDDDTSRASACWIKRSFFKDLAKTSINGSQAVLFLPAVPVSAIEDMQVQKNVCFCKSFDDEMLSLSLSDQYWLNPVDQPLDWKDINFYDNAFSDDFEIFSSARCRKTIH